MSESTASFHKITRYCEQCNVLLVMKNQRDVARRRFCSRACKLLWQHRTNNIGIHLRSLQGHPRWKGGRHTMSNGYIQVLIDGSYQLEHRVVMSRQMGRPLLDYEQVHHINGVRDDNRLENLELWVRGQPTGVRASQLIPHCATCQCGKEDDNASKSEEQKAIQLYAGFGSG